MVELAGRTLPTQPTGWRLLFALRPTMVDFGRRGFRTQPSLTREVLEGAGRAFLTGFNLELATRVDQAPSLSSLPEYRRGFAAEGAAMAAVLLDTLNPAGAARPTTRYATLREAHGARYLYLIQVGAGWAMAKLHRNGLGRIGADEPLLRWLAFDGMGFCQSFFASERGLRRWVWHPDACTDTCEIRYQGLGRSLWFRECGDPSAIAARIAVLPEQHRGDVWSGVALAATYAGGVEPEAYDQLRYLADGHAAHAAQGAAFAAEAWQRCGYAPAHARTSVRALTGVALEEAAEWTWLTRRGLDRPNATAADYRCWRARVRQEAAAATYR